MVKFLLKKWDYVCVIMEMVFVIHHVEFNGFGFARSNGRFVQIAVLLMREYVSNPQHTLKIQLLMDVY
jgi:hypothetical protein